MAPNKNKNSHTTHQELQFITGLGSAATLRGYLAAADKRADWAGMDAAAVIAAARRRLQAIEKRRKGR